MATLRRLRKAQQAKVVRTVPPAEWGKDHWSLLAYVENRCVDHLGTLELIRMRCNTKVHPWLNGAPRGSFTSHNADGSYKYGSILRGTDKREPEHDDHHCFNDLCAAGLVMDIGTGIHPVAKLTPAGTTMAAALRAWKAQGGMYATFDMHGHG